MKAEIKLIFDIGKAICDRTVNDIDLEGDGEKFGALLTLTYLQRLFLDRIIAIERQYE